MNGFDAESLALLDKMYVEWLRLNGHTPSTTALEHAIDEATGAEADRIHEFCKWLIEDILPRMEQ